MRRMATFVTLTVLFLLLWALPAAASVVNMHG